MTISSERWRQCSLAQQMGNIGSELERARLWERRGDRTQRDRSFERALDLIALTIDDRRWRRGVRELARFGEAVAAWFCGSTEYEIAPEALIEYCLGFSRRPLDEAMPDA